MTLADLTLLAAVLVTLGTIGLAKFSGRRDFDNAKPRDPAFYRDPYRARAPAAHQNGLEAFPFFAASVVLAEVRQAPQGLLDGLAVAFIALRLLYVVFYLGDRPAPRSVVWGCAFACNVLIFFLPWWNGR